MKPHFRLPDERSFLEKHPVSLFNRKQNCKVMYFRAIRLNKKNKIMKLRILLVLYFFIIFSISFQGYSQQRKASESDGRPNIIFILTDDQRWDALGYAGNDIIQTPEMDKLAEKGFTSGTHS
jgi:hypothetical protein